MKLAGVCTSWYLKTCIFRILNSECSWRNLCINHYGINQPFKLLSFNHDLCCGATRPSYFEPKLPKVRPKPLWKRWLFHYKRGSFLYPNWYDRVMENDGRQYHYPIKVVFMVQLRSKL